VIAVTLLLFIIIYSWKTDSGEIVGIDYGEREGFATSNYLSPSLIGKMTGRKTEPSLWKDYPPYWWSGNFYNYYPPSYSYVFGAETQQRECQINCVTRKEQCGDSAVCQAGLNECIKHCAP
jgi:hypothetical protein